MLAGGHVLLILVAPADVPVGAVAARRAAGAIFADVEPVLAARLQSKNTEILAVRSRNRHGGAKIHQAPFGA